LYGFVLAIVIGIPLGLLMALSKNMDRLISPFFESIRFIAPIAWVPFAALWFGTGIGGPVLIIFMGAFPPVLINTYRGAIHVDKKFIETYGGGFVSGCHPIYCCRPQNFGWLRLAIFNWCRINRSIEWGWIHDGKGPG
jgi:ABC-type proline/glycine betaine transport system permease subunit